MGSDDWEHHLEGKTYEEAYGEEKAKRIKNDISEGNKGKTVSPEGLENMSKAMRGKNNPMYGNHKPKSEEHKKNTKVINRNLEK
jgi:hypothetical protein